MDEDDGIAILTRRLIAEHEFFRWTVDNPSEYSVVKTSKGKNLKASDSFFTQIEVLYDINLRFLTSASRTARGWKWNDREIIPQKNFKKIWRINRPDEQTLDDYYKELSSIWEGVLERLPDLRRPPVQMRVHNPKEGDEDGASQDHALFWPIGQYILADIVRALLDDYSTQVSKDVLESAEIVDALAPLKRVEWSLHREPCRNLLLVQRPNRAGELLWAMRNEGRAAAIDVAREVLEFIVGVTPLDQKGQDDLQQRWANNLVPIPDEDRAREMWEAVLDQAIGEP